MSKEFKTQSETQFIRTTKLENFTMINNSLIQDKRISWKARGMLIYILSLPDDWVIYAKEVQTHSPDGKASFATGMKELEKYGYIVKEYKRNDKGHIVGMNYRVYDNPDKAVENLENKGLEPKTDYRKSDKPKSDNQTLQITDSTNDLDVQTKGKKVNKALSVNEVCDTLFFEKIEVDENIYSYATNEYGEDRVRHALAIIDKFVDVDYPKVKKREHYPLNQHQRMGFAVKLLEYENETDVELGDLGLIIGNALRSPPKDIKDPLIFFVTKPKVLGNHTLAFTYKDGTKVYCFENVRETEYAPASSWY